LKEQPDIILPAELDKRGHKSRERKCVARGEVRDPAEMIRFVLGPDNQIYPDILGKLPGRGTWVSASREDLDVAIQKGGFKRGFKGNVIIADDLVAQIEAGLKKQTLSLIGMAKKSGKLFIGFDQVMAAARTDALGWRIEARDGAEGSRGKIRTLSKAVAREVELKLPRVIGCFDSTELGAVVGRDAITHCAVPHGRIAKSLGQSAARLNGFLPLVPEGWADAQHEAF
jgi:predicted RNA-binding protein YlxR (DUF448 family)